MSLKDDLKRKVTMKFLFLQVSLVGSRLTIYRPLDIPKLSGDPMGCSGQRLSMPWTPGDRKVKNKMIEQCPNALLELWFVYSYSFQICIIDIFLWSAGIHQDQSLSKGPEIENFLSFFEIPVEWLET